MVDFFIRRPIFAMVISIIIVLLGLLSIRTLPVEQFPNITPPTVQVSALYQGADAITVNQSVATPISQSILGVDNLLYTQSTSANDGTMSLTATFNVGSNPDMNTVFTQNNVATAVQLLPPSVIQQGIKTIKSMGGFLLVFALSSDGRYDNNYLSNYIYLNIQNELLKLNGVGRLQVFGTGLYSMRVWIKPDVLNYLGVSVNDITNALEAQSGVFPSGRLGAEPAPSGTEFTYTVLLPPQIETPEEYGNIVIRTYADGGRLLLKDVARIDLGSQTYTMSSEFNGRPAAMAAVYQSPGSNAMAVGTVVKKTLAGLSKHFNDGMTYDIVVDGTLPIKSGIHDIMITLLMALGLVVLIIYLFIQDVRAMIIPVVAIPVSLIGAFMLFPLLGFTVNIFSLLGLILAIGLVVDDAIVVIEAVQVNISNGLDPRQATKAAMKAVSSPIVATSVVLTAVFVPVSFISGITGQLYQQFAITIAVSMIISAFNALTLSPALCALVLWDKPRATTGFFGWFNRWFGRRVEGYLNYTNVVARHAGRTLIFIGLICLAIFGFTRVIPTGFLPQEDRGYMMVSANLPNASSMQRTHEVLKKIERLITHIPDIKYTSSVTGINLLAGVTSPNSGVVFVTLADYKQRKLTSDQILDRINHTLYPAVNEAQVFAYQAPSIPGLGIVGGVSLMVQDRGGNGIEYLSLHTNQYMEKARQMPEIASIISQFDDGVPQRRLIIDQQQAMLEGVSMSDVHNVLGTFLGGTYINNFNRFGRVYQTYVQSEAAYRQTRNNLSEYYVNNAAGESVPLSSFVRIIDTVGIEYLNQFNLYPAIGLNANTTRRYSTIQAMGALQKLADQTLPNDMSIAWNGMSFQEQAASGSGLRSFALAVVFIFLILAALYESWALPSVILLGVPFAVFGAMLFVFLARLINPVYLNYVFMQISLILLIALSAKNAILIVQYANMLFFEQGKTISEAAIGAARLRFRPILMTALAFLLGVTPLIFASGASSLAQQIMGISLVGGMGIATFIGVFVYPSLYGLIARVGHFERIRERRAENEKALSGEAKVALKEETTPLQE